MTNWYVVLSAIAIGATCEAVASPDEPAPSTDVTTEKDSAIGSLTMEEARNVAALVHSATLNRLQLLTAIDALQKRLVAMSARGESLVGDSSGSKQGIKKFRLDAPGTIDHEKSVEPPPPAERLRRTLQTHLPAGPSARTAPPPNTTGPFDADAATRALALLSQFRRKVEQGSVQSDLISSWATIEALLRSGASKEQLP